MEVMRHNMNEFSPRYGLLKENNVAETRIDRKRIWKEIF